MVLSEENGGRNLLQREGLTLPNELAARGFTLIVRAPDRLFAVSSAWGCTGTKATIRDVIAEAWGLIGFIEYVHRKRAEDDAV